MSKSDLFAEDADYYSSVDEMISTLQEEDGGDNDENDEGDGILIRIQQPFIPSDTGGDSDEEVNSKTSEE